MIRSQGDDSAIPMSNIFHVRLWHAYIGPGNMTAAEQRLKKLSDATIREAETWEWRRNAEITNCVETSLSSLRHE